MEFKIGTVGPGDMGRSLALNMERNGFPVAGHDMDTAKTKAFLSGPGSGKQIAAPTATGHSTRNGSDLGRTNVTIRFYILMGVSGSGKTTVGKELAAQLGWDYYDADDFHPSGNITKMPQGIPLDDEDRAPWLEAMHTLIATCLKDNRPGVLACSALKERYRLALLQGNQAVQVVYLKGGFEMIQARMAARTGHYMKPAMLQSQFDTLEEP